MLHLLVITEVVQGTLQNTLHRITFGTSYIRYVIHTVRRTYGMSYIRYVICTVRRTSDVPLLCSKLSRGVFLGYVIRKNNGTHDVGGHHGGLLGDPINKGLGGAWPR